MTNAQNYVILKMQIKKREVFMRKENIHVFIAMFATLASMITVAVMMLMRFLG